MDSWHWSKAGLRLHLIESNVCRLISEISRTV
jgi:hypothetical protein